jgi:hypothetical protein
MKLDQHFANMACSRTLTKQSWKKRRMKAAPMVVSLLIMRWTTPLTVFSASWHEEL